MIHHDELPDQHEASFKKTKYDDPKLPFVTFFAFINKVLEYATWKKRYGEYRKKFNLPNEFRLNGCNIMINGEGEFEVNGIGVLSHNTFIELDKGSYLQFGKSVWCSKNLVIYVKPYWLEKYNDYTYLESPKTSSLVIGNNVFIMPNVFLQGSSKGITIGNNVIIMPNSVVMHDIPSNSVFKDGKIIRRNE